MDGGGYTAALAANQRQIDQVCELATARAAAEKEHLELERDRSEQATNGAEPVWPLMQLMQEQHHQTTTLMQEQLRQNAEAIQEQHRHTTALMQEQHRHTTALMQEQHRHTTTLMQEQHRQNAALIQDQHRQNAALMQLLQSLLSQQKKEE
jgi:hypothetical protein